MQVRFHFLYYVVFQVAGSIMNMGMYNEYPFFAKIRPCLIKCGTDRIKNYVRCFAAEMGDYMDKRTKKTSLNRLYYFNLMARAEPIRMLLSYSGLNYADCRCTP